MGKKPIWWWGEGGKNAETSYSTVLNFESNLIWDISEALSAAEDSWNRRSLLIPILEWYFNAYVYHDLQKSSFED